MVGEDIDYVVVESDGRPAPPSATSSPRPGWRRTPASSATTRTVRGAAKGSRPASAWTYTPPFSYYAGHENAFRVVPAEFVTTTDGTGLVHTAGAFGEDDKVVTDREGIEAVMPVGKDGALHVPGHRLRGHAGLRRQPARSSTT